MDSFFHSSEVPIYEPFIIEDELISRELRIYIFIMNFFNFLYF